MSGRYGDALRLGLYSLYLDLSFYAQMQRIRTTLVYTNTHNMTEHVGGGGEIVARPPFPTVLEIVGH